MSFFDGKNYFYRTKRRIFWESLLDWTTRCHYWQRLTFREASTPWWRTEQKSQWIRCNNLSTVFETINCLQIRLLLCTEKLTNKSAPKRRKVFFKKTTDLFTYCNSIKSRRLNFNTINDFTFYRTSFGGCICVMKM